MKKATAKKSINKNLTADAKFVRGIQKEIAANKKTFEKLTVWMGSLEKNLNRITLGH